MQVAIHKYACAWAGLKKSALAYKPIAFRRHSCRFLANHNAVALLRHAQGWVWKLGQDIPGRCPLAAGGDGDADASVAATGCSKVQAVRTKWPESGRRSRVPLTESRHVTGGLELAGARGLRSSDDIQPPVRRSPGARGRDEVNLSNGFIINF